MSNGTTRACAGSRFTALTAGVSHSGTSAGLAASGASARAAQSNQQCGGVVRMTPAVRRRLLRGVKVDARGVDARVANPRGPAQPRIADGLAACPCGGSLDPPRAPSRQEASIR